MRILALIGVACALCILCQQSAFARGWHYHRGGVASWGYGAAPTPYGWGNGHSSYYPSPVLQSFNRNEDRRRQSLPDSAFIQNYSWAGQAQPAMNAAAPRQPYQPYDEHSDYGQAYDQPHMAASGMGDYYSALYPKHHNSQPADIQQGYVANPYGSSSTQNAVLQNPQQYITPAQPVANSHAAEQTQYSEQQPYVPSFESEFFPSHKNPAWRPDSATSAQKGRAH